MGRRELFPRDPRLIAQMVLATVLTPVMVVGLLVLAVMLLPGSAIAGLALAVAVGIGLVVRERSRDPGGLPSQADAAQLRALVERLCVIADLAAPEVVIERHDHPNSWVVDLPGRPPRLHVTRGLIELLSGDELAAVLAHELSHIANRDAAVMTVVGMPGTVLMMGTRRGCGGGFMMLGVLVARLVGLVSLVGTSALSRCRELAADQGACAITGRPSALASALLKVSGAISATPTADLRAVAALDSFHLLPVRARRRRWYDRIPGVRRLGATHPSLERRLKALDALERSAHRARLIV